MEGHRVQSLRYSYLESDLRFLVGWFPFLNPEFQIPKGALKTYTSTMILLFT